MSPQIKVHRKKHHRRGYQRKDGTQVSETNVKETTYSREGKANAKRTLKSRVGISSKTTELINKSKQIMEREEKEKKRFGHRYVRAGEGFAFAKLRDKPKDTLSYHSEDSGKKSYLSLKDGRMATPIPLKESELNEIMNGLISRVARINEKENEDFKNKFDHMETKYYTLLPYIVWYSNDEVPTVQIDNRQPYFSFQLNENLTDAYFKLLNANDSIEGQNYIIEADTNRQQLIVKDVFSDKPIGWILYFDAKKGLLDHIETRTDPEFLIAYIRPDYRKYEPKPLEEMKKEEEKKKEEKKDEGPSWLEGLGGVYP